MKKVMFIIVGMLVSVSVNAATYTGTFNGDDDVVYVSLNVTESALYHFESFGYAGGTMSDGTVVSDGGFDSVFHLFSPFATEIAYMDDGRGVASASSGSSFDFMTDIWLAAGNYYIAITQFSNFWDGSNWEGSQTTGFEDIDGNIRSDAYAFEYTVSAVPVPAALFLFAPALLGFLGLRRKAAA